MRLHLFAPLLPFLCALTSVSAVAQRAYTAADYAQAERLMGYNTNSLVVGTMGGVTYLPDGRLFFHQSLKGGGTEYHVADPAAKTITAPFDATKLAAALGGASGRKVDPLYLGITEYTPRADGGSAVTTGSGEFDCTKDMGTCTPVARPQRVQQPEQKPDAQPPAGLSATQTGGNAQMNAQMNSPANSPANPQANPGTNPLPGAGTGTPAQRAARPVRPVGRSKSPFDLSPDKKQAAFIRDWNLWVRDEVTGQERQLTTDGIKDFGYATDNAGWTHSDAPILLWSPDSKKIATFQQDQRKTGMMYLVSVTNKHPELDAWRYPFLGDKEVTMIERVAIDVPSGQITRLKMPPDQHRSTLCDDVSCRGGAGFDDVQFSPDSKQLAFVSTSRDHKDEWLRVADTSTGAVREVYHEHAPSYYESGQGKVNWHVLFGSNEFLWYSERSNWGQMYLYDFATGKLKHEVTRGEGPVTQVLHFDEKNRVMYFLATGKEAGQDPYYTHYYRVGFDGKQQQLLTPEAADHAVTPSSDGSTFVDVYSTVQTPQTAVLRDNSGHVLVPLGKQDISALQATGWKPPTPITVKARDGKTPLYGYLFQPTSFDPGKKYPVIDYVYPGPQIGSCGSRSFTAAHGDNAALAELGFVVVCIDGMGTPFRSKSFHDFYAHAETMGDNTVPDQMAGIKDLASRSPWMDLDHVGIWGHSGGGNATSSAMLGYPEFFKVGIAESGNHDNRIYEDDWDEKWGGLETIENGRSNYETQAAQNYAKNLKGKLLLAHGTSDDNVPPNNTLMLVDALVKANKDFDLLLIPNAHHGYGEGSQYMMRRRWDYFVRNLAGGTPPENYQTKPYAEVFKALYGPDAEAEPQ